MSVQVGAMVWGADQLWPLAQGPVSFVQWAKRTVSQREVLTVFALTWYRFGSRLELQEMIYQ